MAALAKLIVPGTAWLTTTTITPAKNSSACSANATASRNSAWCGSATKSSMKKPSMMISWRWDFDADLSCGVAPFGNLIIEGDNFDALRFLRMTHAGKVKCIYIDPPYNTGNRDFIYNDRFIDKEDAYKHSKWLEFMYRRLELAKELLAEDGVIFVSIDDNEVFNIGLLMNRVFGGK
jgi:hypothetical protein